MRICCVRVAYKFVPGNQALAVQGPTESIVKKGVRQELLALDAGVRSERQLGLVFDDALSESMECVPRQPTTHAFIPVDILFKMNERIDGSNYSLPLVVASGIRIPTPV